MALFKDDPTCIKQREHVNIPAWHRKGYAGAGLTVAHADLGGSHSEACADIIQTILPDARVLEINIGGRSENNKMVECTVDCLTTGEELPFEEFIRKYDVSMINASYSNKTKNPNSPYATYLKEMRDNHNLVITCSNGNSSNEYGRFLGAAIMVSGVYFDGKGEICTYGSVKEYTDFTAFMGFQMGTSFSAPFLCGMAGLLRSKYGREMTQQEVYDYFKAHAEDLGSAGRDNNYGWGLPVMGEPRTCVKIKIGANFMTVDGRVKPLDQPAEIVRKTGRTLVPIRAIAEAFGADVAWDGKAKEITLWR